jgi:1-hydroxy-2-naphthoate dioxygenase
MSKLDELNRELEEKNLLGYWNIVRGRGDDYEPKSSFEPSLWKWKDIWSGLEKAGETLDLEQSFRRFIAFATPSLGGSTTHTLLLGAQLVKPGEVAKAHHHTMGAIRFVVRGGGAQTVVDGEPFPMYPGDLVTTPGWTWHDHYNGSKEPIVWLDGADGPFLRFLQAGFGERYESDQQPQSRAVGTSGYELSPTRPAWIKDSKQPPPYRYRWEDTEKALNALGERPGDPHDGIVLRYANPLNGGPTLPTLSCEMHMLRPGERTKDHRHTSSAIYHVFRGKGSTTIDGVRREWEEGDSFTVPLWRWHAHASEGREPALLFVMNDKPVLDAFGWYREAVREIAD